MPRSVVALFSIVPIFGVALLAGQCGDEQVVCEADEATDDSFALLQLQASHDPRSSSDIRFSASKPSLAQKDVMEDVMEDRDDEEDGKTVLAKADQQEAKREEKVMVKAKGKGRSEVRAHAKYEAAELKKQPRADKNMKHEPMSELQQENAQGVKRDVFADAAVFHLGGKGVFADAAVFLAAEIAGHDADEQHPHASLIQPSTVGSAICLILGAAGLLAGGGAVCYMGVDGCSPQVDIDDVRKRRYAIIFAAFAFQGWEFISAAQFVPNLAQMKKDLGGGSFGPALSVQMLYVLKGVTGLLWGVLADHIGRRKVMLSCFILNIISVMACGFAPTIWWFQIARVLQGIGEGATVILQSVARDLFDDPEERAQAYNYLMVITIVAPIIAPSIGGVLGVWLGWRTVFVIMAIAMLCTFPIIYSYFEEPLFIDHQSREYWTEVKGFFSTYQIYALMICPSVNAALLVFFGSNMAPLLEQGFDVTVLQMSLIVGVLCVFCVVAGVVYEVVVQKIGVYKFTFFACSMMTVPLIVGFTVGVFANDSLWALLAFQFSFSFLFLFFEVSFATMFTEPLSKSVAFATAVKQFVEMTICTLAVAMPGAAWIASLNSGSHAEIWSSRDRAYVLWHAICIAISLLIFWFVFGLNPPKWALKVRDDFDAACALSEKENKEEGNKDGEMEKTRTEDERLDEGRSPSPRS